MNRVIEVLSYVLHESACPLLMKLKTKEAELDLETKSVLGKMAAQIDVCLLSVIQDVLREA